MKYHQPRYVILENVSNLKGHDNGNTWKTIKNELENLEYEVVDAIISPHEFGIPQHRRRIYIVCEHQKYGHLEGFAFPHEDNPKECNISDIIDYDETNYQHLKDDTRMQLDVWREFLKLCRKNKVAVPSFPIWAMEFGATYDYEEQTPFSMSLAELKRQRGTLGRPIEGTTRKECLACLPSYSRVDAEAFPDWKIKYIKQNRCFYLENKSWLDPWREKIRDFCPSHQKMEWNCGDAEPVLDDKIIQFRASGIRIKMPTFSPALNLVGTQVPIMGGKTKRLI